MTERNTSQFDWFLLFQWMVVTTLGWFLGQALFPHLAFVTTGLGIGILQWMVLQHHIDKAWRWIVACTLGWTAGWVLVFIAVPAEFEFLLGPVVGATLGTAQWLVLRGEIRWAGWWIVVNILAWTTGLTLLPGILLSGLMPSTLTGITLELLLRNPRLMQTQKRI